MPPTLQLDIPLAWLRKSSPNARPGNWQQRMRETSDLKSDAYVLALEQGERNGRWPLRDPVASVEVIGPKAWDRDNLIASLKAAIDGIVEAGAIEDDVMLRWGMIMFEQIHPRHAAFACLTIEGCDTIPVEGG